MHRCTIFGAFLWVHISYNGLALTLTSPLIRIQLQYPLTEKGAATSSLAQFQKTIDTGVEIAENLHEILYVTY